MSGRLVDGSVWTEDGWVEKGVTLAFGEQVLAQEVLCTYPEENEMPSKAVTQPLNGASKTGNLKHDSLLLSQKKSLIIKGSPKIYMTGWKDLQKE